LESRQRASSQAGRGKQPAADWKSGSERQASRVGEVARGGLESRQGASGQQGGGSGSWPVGVPAACVGPAGWGKWLVAGWSPGSVRQASRVGEVAGGRLESRQRASSQQGGGSGSWPDTAPGQLGRRGGILSGLRVALIWNPQGAVLADEWRALAIRANSPPRRPLAAKCLW
jgi:hypothetical protein